MADNIPRALCDGQPLRQSQRREQMWRAMRSIKEFTWRDILLYASLEDIIIFPSEARRYVQYLHKAGYLVELTPSQPSHQLSIDILARYRLLPSRNTGPRPPMIQRLNQVFDPNLGEVVWSQNGEG
jgi:hypothetical protein